jgi:hypothetical protein
LCACLCLGACSEDGALGAAGDDADGENQVRLESAIAASLPYLDSEAAQWLDDEGCYSCHHVPFGIWAMEEARRAGVDHLWDGLDDLNSYVVPSDDPDDRKTLVLTPMLLGRSADRETGLDAIATSQLIVYRQESGGYWEPEGQFNKQRRATNEERRAVATLWTVLALSSVDLASDGTRVTVQAAQQWLASTPDGTSTEWLVGTMLVDHAYGRPHRDHLDILLDIQNDDGGWPWLPSETSNVFLTGMVLYALMRVGHPANDPSTLAALEYVLVEQGDQGFWSMEIELATNVISSTTVPIYEFWGTAWATIGLSSVLQTLRFGTANAPPE